MIRAGTTRGPSRNISQQGGGGFVSPAPESRQGRLDAGVDYESIRGNIVAVASGRITNLYQSLRGFGYTIIEKLQGGPDVYYGLETGGAPVKLSVGQPVTQGQQIAQGLQTGGIEVGFWNPATGRPVGQYTEGGSPTPAAQQFASEISGGGVPQTSLEQLWIENGGPPGVAQTMAAIAMAESSGRLDATNKNTDGSVDYGPWQVNSSHGFDPTLLTTDPNYSARAAVAVYKQQGLRAWTTYQTGAFRKFLGSAATATLNYGGPNGGIIRPGGGSGSTDNSAGVQQALQNYTNLRDTPRTAPPGTRNPATWWWASFTDNWNNL